MCQDDYLTLAFNRTHLVASHVEQFQGRNRLTNNYCIFVRSTVILTTEPTQCNPKSSRRQQRRQQHADTFNLCSIKLFHTVEFAVINPTTIFINYYSGELLGLLLLGCCFTSI